MPPRCQGQNRGQRASLQPGKVGEGNGAGRMGRDRGKKTKPKNNSFQTIAFYSMYRARRAEHPGTATPQGRV